MKEIQKVPAKLKHKVEDFIVEEIGEKWICKISKEFIPNQNPHLEILEIESQIESPKDFLLLEMEKQNIDHFQSIKNISRILKENLEDIGYAGTKDKRAWTSQRISIFQPDLIKLKEFKHPNIILKNFKWGKRKIKIGYLEKNSFRITLRDIDKKDAIKLSSKIRSLDWFPNYFGAQRFGGNNLKVGKLLLKKRFKEAYKEITNEEAKEDPLRELKRVGRKNMLMYINSVQSQIFNEILKTALEEGLDFTKKGQESCLLVGYKSRFYKGKLGQIEQEILRQHNLTLEDFDIKEIPYLRIKGSFRKAITTVEDLKVQVEDDEEFVNSKKIILEFTLPSGVYATTYLDNFFIFS